MCAIGTSAFSKESAILALKEQTGQNS
uniref:Uncharacterized protein n=1 Tax=Anguilla anguilla TaxID=7936 RepID=A0A0E9V6M5_ANGAN